LLLLIGSDTNLLTTATTSDPVIIDVSKCLGNPRILHTDDTALVIRPMRDSLCNALVNLNAPKDYVNVAVLPGVNRTTMFGLMLGYPVLYWYKCARDDDNMAGDCLSFVPLCVKRTLISMCSNCHRTCRKTKGTSQEKQLILMHPFKSVSSFSYPESLSDGCSSAFAAWKQTASEAAEVRGDGMLVKFDCEIVTLSVVAM